MKSILFLICPYFLFGLDLTAIESITHWETLQQEPVQINWTTYNSFPICKAEQILNHPIDKVANRVKNLEQYATIFDRVSKAKRLDKDIVQIVLDMPFPFDGRDYIVQYKIESSSEQWIVSFESVDHPDGVLDSDHVRLPNAAGVWILTKINDHQTKILYGWNGELLGNFPEFGLTRAWVTQGTEVLTWLDDSLKYE